MTDFEIIIRVFVTAFVFSIGVYGISATLFIVFNRLGKKVSSLHRHIMALSFALIIVSLAGLIAWFLLI